MGHGTLVPFCSHQNSLDLWMFIPPISEFHRFFDIPKGLQEPFGSAIAVVGIIDLRDRNQPIVFNLLGGAIPILKNDGVRQLGRMTSRI